MRNYGGERKQEGTPADAFTVYCLIPYCNRGGGGARCNSS